MTECKHVWVMALYGDIWQCQRCSLTRNTTPLTCTCGWIPNSITAVHQRDCPAAPPATPIGNNRGYRPSRPVAPPACTCGYRWSDEGTHLLNCASLRPAVPPARKYVCATNSHAPDCPGQPVCEYEGAASPAWCGTRRPDGSCLCHDPLCPGPPADKPFPARGEEPILPYSEIDALLAGLDAMPREHVPEWVLDLFEDAAAAIRALRAESDVLGGHMECAKLEQERLRAELEDSRRSGNDTCLAWDEKCEDLRRDLDAARAEVGTRDIWMQEMQAEVERLRAKVYDMEENCSAHSGDYTLRAERAEVEVERLKRQASCLYAGVGFADISGIYCPFDKPCDRCQIERAEALARELAGLLAVWAQSDGPDPLDETRAALARAKEVLGE